MKIASETFKMILCFNFRYPLLAFFCSNVIYHCTCSCDNNTSYIGMTTTQLLERIENHFSTTKSLSNSAIKSHRDQRKASSVKLYIIEKVPFNTEAEVMKFYVSYSSAQLPRQLTFRTPFLSPTKQLKFKKTFFGLPCAVDFHINFRRLASEAHYKSKLRTVTWKRC